MRFTIRGVLLVTVLVALAVAEVVSQTRCERRCRQVERLIHRVDADVHEHLGEFDARLRANEGAGL